MWLRSHGKIVVLIAVVVCAGASFAVHFVPEKVSTPMGDFRGVRDDNELTVFYTRGSWLPQDVTPYGKDSFQEYPQLGLAYITLPFLATADYLGYRTILITMNLLCAVGLIVSSYKLIKHLGGSPWLIMLLVLPSMLYFTFSRFDVCIAFLVQTSLYFLIVRRRRLSLFILACAVLVKWYPLILLPLYWYYERQQPSVVHSRVRNDVAVYFIVPITLVLAGGFIMDGIYSLQPYLFHASRAAGTGSLYSILLAPALQSLGGSAVNYIGFGFFLLLQASVPLAFVFFPHRMKKSIQTPAQFISWCVIAVTLFLLCSRFYSPQWILWFVPLIIVCRPRWYEVALVIAYDVINYFAYPVVWQLWGNWTPAFTTASLLLVAIAMVLIMVRFVRIRQAEHGAPTPA
ncbi:MAG: hypothetical protein PHY34_00135 [Patescibacteria group bacterium]|nr:hypothetical protein [Patescibacteria group bacterium]MDD5715960.1 hypothetical protein [Patescibacteria group bacterium]